MWWETDKTKVGDDADPGRGRCSEQACGFPVVELLRVAEIVEWNDPREGTENALVPARDGSEAQDAGTRSVTEGDARIADLGREC